MPPLMSSMEDASRRSETVPDELIICEDSVSEVESLHFECDKKYVRKRLLAHLGGRASDGV
jgi:hypothetical protein